jgi:hypothetical protein
MDHVTGHPRVTSQTRLFFFLFFLKAQSFDTYPIIPAFHLKAADFTFQIPTTFSFVFFSSFFFPYRQSHPLHISFIYVKIFKREKDMEAATS